MIEIQHYKNNVHFSKELEMAILGACILEKTAFGRIYGILQEEHFWVEDNKQIFKCLSRMWFDGLPIDLLTVDYFLAQKGLNELGGKTNWYLVEVTKNVVSSAHLEFHSLLVREMFIKREMLRLTSSGMGVEQDALAYMDKLNEEFLKLRHVHSGDDFKPIDQLLVELYSHMDQVKDKAIIGVTSGFSRWDSLTGGLMRGGLYVLAARPSVGKSAFMGKMAIAAAKSEKKVGIVSLEMDSMQITSRLASLVSGIEYRRIRRSMLDEEDQRDRFYESMANELGTLPIRISDVVGVDVNDVKAKIAIMVQRGELDILFVDYLQLLEEDMLNRNYNREQAVAKMSRGLKLAAKEFSIPIVLLAQLNRVSESTGNKKPRLHNLRESGAIEQDADGVVFLHRDWMSDIKEDENGYSTESQADIIIAKWREGETAEYKIRFDGSRMEFSEIGEPSGFANPSLPYKDSPDPF